MKNMWSRIIENKIILFQGSDIINIETIDQILYLDKTGKASRGMATMRDALTLKLINDENLSILAENIQYCCIATNLHLVLFTICKKLYFFSYDINNKISRESEKLPQ